MAQNQNRKPVLIPIVRKPPAVELRSDGVVFNLVGPGGQIEESLGLTLSELMASGDITGLLLFGIMAQMNELRQHVDKAQEIVDGINPLDPKAIEQHMATMAPVVFKLMKNFGIIPPGMDLPEAAKENGG